MGILYWERFSYHSPMKVSYNFMSIISDFHKMQKYSKKSTINQNIHRKTLIKLKRFAKKYDIILMSSKEERVKHVKVKTSLKNPHLQWGFFFTVCSYLCWGGLTERIRVNLHSRWSVHHSRTAWINFLIVQMEGGNEGLPAISERNAELRGKTS